MAHTVTARADAIFKREGNNSGEFMAILSYKLVSDRKPEH